MIPCRASAESAERASSADSILVLGIGNVLLADEGAGVHAMRQLERDGRWSGVRFADGGTLSFTLAGLIESTAGADRARRRRHERAAGERRDIRRGSAWMRSWAATANAACTKWRLLDLMALAALEGNLPEKRALIGIQPQTIDWSESPSEPVARAIPEACARARELIERWQS